MRFLAQFIVRKPVFVATLLAAGAVCGLNLALAQPEKPKPVSPWAPDPPAAAPTR